MIFRSAKTKNYTVMSNYHLRDNNLSLKAKGLMSLLLSLPDDWDFSINGLLTLIKESETCLNNALSELKKNHYLIVTKTKDEKGQFDYIYELFELPQMAAEPTSTNPDIQNLSMEKQGQLNTNIINTKEQNTDVKEKNTKKESLQKMSPVQALPLIKEEFDLSEDVIEALKGFIEVRKAKKSPLTGHSLRLLIFDLIKLSTDPEKQVKIINQSVVNAWKGFFELKEDRQAYYRQPTAPIDEPIDAVEKVRRRLLKEEEERRKNATD